MYLKLDESKWYRHTQEWSDRLKGIGKVEVYKGQIEVVEDVAPVVHAHWEYRYDTGIYQTEFLCSRCKGLIETYSCTVDEVEYEYCPHCGAKMDEE